MSIKVGDVVRLKKDCSFYKMGDRFTGKITRIDLWEGELTTQNHGGIEIELITTDSYYLEPGELEHFAYYGWEEYLELVEEV